MQTLSFWQTIWVWINRKFRGKPSLPPPRKLEPRVRVVSSSSERPPWLETCDCITVAVDVPLPDENSTEAQQNRQWEETVRNAYESGASWAYNPACSLCDRGRLKP